MCPAFRLPLSGRIADGSRKRVLVRPMRYLAVMAIGATLLLGGCDDITSSYNTLADARDDRLFDRGWLPDVLPASAHDIRVTSDLDANSAEGEFSFDPADFPSFAAEFESFYQPFTYTAGGYTWTFFCDAASGHCYFSMR